MKDFLHRLQQLKLAHFFHLMGMSVFFILLLFPILLLAVPDRTYSSAEKRNLTQFPVPSIDSIVDTSYMDTFEEYMADQFPLRNAWMTLKTEADHLLGKYESQGVYIGKKHTLMERFDLPNAENERLTQEAICEFAKRYPDIPAYFMLVPNQISIQTDLIPKEAPRADQFAYMDEMFQAVGKSVYTVDLRSVFEENADTMQLYYKTDHHWTTDAAFLAYQELAKKMELTEDENWKSAVVCDSFKGSLASKSGFWIPAKDLDVIKVYQNTSQSDYLVTYGETQTKSASCYQMEYLDSDDPYQIFFGGNHTEVTIETTADTNRKLLVFKDSYANCFLPFLFSDFKYITVVDPRYYYDDIDTLMLMNSYTDILYLYNVNTFSEDNNLRLVLGE